MSGESRPRPARPSRRTAATSAPNRHKRATRQQDVPAVPAPDMFVSARAGLVTEPLCWFTLGTADRPCVAPGDVVSVGDPLFERVRDVHVSQSQPTGGLDAEPGAALDPSGVGLASERRRARPADRGTVLFQGPEGRLRVALGRSSGKVLSVVSGAVESVDARGIAIRAEADGLPGAIRWGRSVRGPLMLAVSTPDGDLRASAIDVSAAGAIVVAGARLDIEAITRARALGVRGIICGGLMSRELRQLDASEARQRAATQALEPFAVLALDGYGRRPIPGPVWDALSAAAGREVSIVADPPLVLLEPGIGRRASAELVRVTAGRDLGREGRLLDLRGQVRGAGGVYQAAGLVSLDGRTPSDPVERRAIALADLERLD